MTAASFGRHDEVAEAKFGNASAYGQVTGANSQSGDYKDGNGNSVHSAYRRYSLNGAVGLTPDADTRIELLGTKFLRQNIGLKFERAHVSPLFEKVEALVSSNNVDHIMDDQTLRTPGMMGYVNLKRDTIDGRLAATLRIADPTKLTLGVDTQTTGHSSSSKTAMPGAVYTAFRDDAAFRQQGAFGEVDHLLDDKQRIIAGYRADFWKAQDKRGSMIMNYNIMDMSMNPSSGQQRSETLHSGFARYERQLVQHAPGKNQPDRCRGAVQNLRHGLHGVGVLQQDRRFHFGGLLADEQDGNRCRQEC